MLDPLWQSHVDNFIRGTVTGYFVDKSGAWFQETRCAIRNNEKFFCWGMTCVKELNYYPQPLIQFLSWKEFVSLLPYWHSIWYPSFPNKHTNFYAHTQIDSYYTYAWSVVDKCIEKIVDCHQLIRTFSTCLLKKKTL